MPRGRSTSDGLRAFWGSWRMIRYPSAVSARQAARHVTDALLGGCAVRLTSRIAERRRKFRMRVPRTFRVTGMKGLRAGDEPSTRHRRSRGTPSKGASLREKPILTKTSATSSESTCSWDSVARRQQTSCSMTTTGIATPLRVRGSPGLLRPTGECADHPTRSASAPSSAAPSPVHALPCMQASVVGLSAASRSSNARLSGAWA